MKSRRKRIGLGIGMCAIASLLGSNAAFAADADSIWKDLGLKVTGAVDVTYTQNFNNPNTNLNSLRIFDTQANSFVPQVAQLMIERPAVAGSAIDRVGFRARLNFGAQSRFSRARTNYQPGTDNNELDVQELYAEYIAPIGNGLKIQAGKINTLIGYETINSWENPSISRSWTFGLSQAFTTTGVRVTYPFGSWATVALGVINGWDNIEDNNRSKTFEWKADFTPLEMFGIAFYGSYGAEQSNGNAIFGNAVTGGCPNGATGCDPTAKRTVVGSIITIKPTAKDTLILEPYYGNEGNATTGGFNSSSTNARWNALLAYYTHDFNDQSQPHAFRFSARGEIFEDAGGVRTCVGGNNFNGGANVCGQDVSGGASPGGFVPGGGLFNAQTGFGQRQTLWGGTFTLQYKPAPLLITRVEFRYDKSDHNVFLRDNVGINNQQTLAFQVVYLF